MLKICIDLGLINPHMWFEFSLEPMRDLREWKRGQVGVSFYYLNLFNLFKIIFLFYYLHLFNQFKILFLFY